MTSETIAVSIHGPRGVLDLVVPPGVAAADLAREYAERSGLPSIPLIYSSSGQALRPDVGLAEAGIDTGSVLVATTTVPRTPTPRGRPAAAADPVTGAGPVAVTLLTVAAALAALAGWFGAHVPSESLRLVVLSALAAAAVVGVAPVGRHADHRVLAAPAFAGAAALVVVWDPVPDRLPMVTGIVGLVCAVAASLGRSLSEGPDEGLRVWMYAGTGLFVLCGLGTLLSLGTTTVFSVLLVVAVLAARFVPLLAIEVPDQYLIDLERLAVTAWSARERPRGRRGRTVVSPAVVADVAARGARTVTAACAAIAVVSALSAAVLLSRVGPELDRIGVRLIALLGGAALLLAGRSHRHRAARWLLRVAGLSCWVALGTDLLGDLGELRRTTLALVAIGLGVAVVVAAVATGRGWRSVWWSRRAEVAEGLCAAAALACLVLATGVFRTLWETNT